MEEFGKQAKGIDDGGERENGGKEDGGGKEGGDVQFFVRPL